MTTIVNILIGILGCFSVSTSGYMNDPLYAQRSFNLFSLLPLTPKVKQSDFAKASARITALEIIAANTPTLVQLAAVQAAVAAVQAAAAAAAAPKCSAAVAAIGGKVIGNFCYTLGATAKKFPDAQADCAMNGGTLAEPTTSTTVAASKAFYDSIKSNFDPTFTTAVGTNNLWIGLKRAASTTPFTFTSTAPFTAAPSVIFITGGTGTLATGAAGADAEAATLNSNGNYVNEKQTETKNYICQFPAF